MSSEWKSQIGQQIYEALLPQVYRNRDNNRFDSGNQVTELGDLAKYLDASGELLDLIRKTLDQRLADSFPDNDADGESCQEWLIPYFAQLVDARLLSPEAEGRRDEVANAVAWRQRKGTLRCVEDIAESVGQIEAEIQEGWKRVAHTPRIGMPLLPAAAFGETEPDITHPLEAIKHPALPTVMLDMRYPSRAVLSDLGRADERRTSFSGTELSWRQLNPRGLPCFPDSYEDMSPRTVDMRTPDWHQGHYHPKRLLLHVPVPAGFFFPEQRKLQWSASLETSTLLEVVEEDGVQVFRGRTERPLCINGSITLTEEKNYRFENVALFNKVTVSFGYLELRNVIARNVEVKTVNHEKPVLKASDCLLNKITVGTGLARLDRCTVLKDAVCPILEAGDSIFAGVLKRATANSAPPQSGEIKYCRLPDTVTASSASAELNIVEESVTYDVPAFFAGTVTENTDKELTENGAGVLHPNCPASIVSGASDGGEMGFFHQGRQSCPTRISGNLSGDKSLTFPADYDFLLYDIVFLGDVTVSSDSNVAYLKRVAAKSLTVETNALSDADGNALPVLDARDCLFDSLTVINGLARLEYCTVMVSADFNTIQASDSVFAGSLNPGDGGCVRYSRIPEGLSESEELSIQIREKRDTNTRFVPVFFEMSYCKEVGGEIRAVKHVPEFKETAYGVLHPATSERVRFGAEDRGEMGAYHHKHYCLRADAVLDKLTDYMPVNLEPVVIFDRRLNRMPPPIKGGYS